MASRNNSMRLLLKRQGHQFYEYIVTSVSCRFIVSWENIIKLPKIRLTYAASLFIKKKNTQLWQETLVFPENFLLVYCLFQLNRKNRRWQSYVNFIVFLFETIQKSMKVFSNSLLALFPTKMSNNPQSIQNQTGCGVRGK